MTARLPWVKGCLLFIWASRDSQTIWSASYYTISRKRFVDNICQQVINHFLLEGDESPLEIFSSELVMGLEDGQLEMIAGEDAQTRYQRSILESDIKNLEAAMRVLQAKLENAQGRELRIGSYNSGAVGRLKDKAITLFYLDIIHSFRM